MKRFVAFQGQTFYPQRGFADLFGSYDTLEEAKAAQPAYAGYDYDWYEIWDTADDTPTECS